MNKKEKLELLFLASRYLEKAEDIMVDFIEEYKEKNKTIAGMFILLGLALLTMQNIINNLKEEIRKEP
jgi:methanogenic corrinoid protein MtbC1